MQYSFPLLFIVAGIARLMTESRHDGHHVPWVLPPGISQSQLGGVFKLDWLHKYATLPYTVCLCEHLHIYMCMFWEGLGGSPRLFYAFNTKCICVCTVLLWCIESKLHMYRIGAHNIFLY